MREFSFAQFVDFLGKECLFLNNMINSQLWQTKHNIVDGRTDDVRTVSRVAHMMKVFGQGAKSLSPHDAMGL